MLDDGEGWWTRTVKYGDAYYSARCPECARFVKCDDVAQAQWDVSAELAKPNATCKKHGRVKTPFLAWASDCEG